MSIARQNWFQSNRRMEKKLAQKMFSPYFSPRSRILYSLNGWNQSWVSGRSSHLTSRMRGNVAMDVEDGCVCSYSAFTAPLTAEDVERQDSIKGPKLPPLSLI
jgi:hypothetical protein